jgi:hypothetical protein
MRNVPSSVYNRARRPVFATLALSLIVTSGIFIGPQSNSGDINPTPERAPMAERNTPLNTRELRIVDASGTPRIVLTAEMGQAAFRVLGDDGTAMVSIALDPVGHASLKLSNPDAKLPTASIEIDDKGAHVKFDKPGGASSYLFLNNAGESGVVLIDKSGARRLDILLPTNGDAVVHRFGSSGRPLPRSRATEELR